jgi:hypothetical protein
VQTAIERLLRVPIRALKRKCSTSRAQRGRRRLSPRKPRVVPDAADPGMWRVRWPDGRLSDMTSLTRAKDAVACFVETEERRQRGRHRPSESRPFVKTGEMPAPIVPASGEHRAPEITLMKKRGPNPVMSKRIFLDAQGKVCSDVSQRLMAHGIATRAAAETAADLASSTSRI